MKNDKSTNGSQKDTKAKKKNINKGNADKSGTLDFENCPSKTTLNAQTGNKMTNSDY